MLTSTLRTVFGKPWLLGFLALVLIPDRPSVGQVMLDDFEDISGWTTSASEGTDVWIVQDTGHTGKGMRIGFDLHSGGGYFIVHKTFSIPLPANYAFTFYLHGEAPRNNFEFKLIDPSGKNVWWRKQRDATFPTDWQQVTIRKSRIEFAWGPAGRELKRVGAIEFAVSSSSGGKGSIWIDDLAFEEREPSSPDGVTPALSVSTSIEGHDPPLMIDQDPGTSWKSAPTPENQSVIMDLLKNREYGGLAIDWDAEDYAVSYQVQVSNDAQRWTSAFTTTSGSGGRDYIYMPDAESRYIRLDLQRSSRGQGYGIATITLKPFEFSASPNQFFAAIAQDAPVGTYPKYLYGRQTYWTLVGVNGDKKEALLNEEGMLEVDTGSFSIEPFLFADGKLLTWNDVQIAQELEQGYLPIPSVTWQHDHLALRITAFASGAPGLSNLYAAYHVENQGDADAPVTLFVAIRPFQVNPPWQTLNVSGGVTTIRDIRLDGHIVTVNRDSAVVPLTPADDFGAATFEQGAVTSFLQSNRLPPAVQATDPFGFASGALRYTLDLAPKAHADVYLAIPFHEPTIAMIGGMDSEEAESFMQRQLDETRRSWESILNRVDIQLPAGYEQIGATLKTTLAYILVNRDGAAIQPGSRNYARSWIRDGAFTSTALLEMGCTQEVRDFIRWFASYQLADGKIPCCVDRRGPDSVPENDSNGEFVYLVAQYYRFTHDVGFLQDMWPHVVAAVDYLSALRRKRTTSAYRTPEKEAFYGLLPESISHEGYSAHPVHSYWDDFFALRGFVDFVSLANVVGDTEHATSAAALRDDFRHDLYASIAKVMADHGIDYIPASADLGDFDPTSTAVALDPGGELANLPAAPLARTFEKYYADFEQRRSAPDDGQAYTPYELRNVGALIRLGQREQAWQVLNFILADRRPAAWNEWAEVVWRDPALPRFIGDMPHTWVGSSFIHAVREMFAYERDADRALVIAAGVPSVWTSSEPGITVKRLPTYYGILNYTLRPDGPNTLRLSLSGDLTLPPGNIVVQPPLPQPLKAVTVNGKPSQTFTAEAATISEFPAEVTLEY